MPLITPEKKFLRVGESEVIISLVGAHEEAVKLIGQLNQSLASTQNENILSRISEGIKTNIKTIRTSFDALHKKFWDHAKPILETLRRILDKEEKLLHILNSYDRTQASYDNIQQMFAELKILRTNLDKINFSFNKIIGTLNQRVEQLQTQINAISKSENEAIRLYQRLLESYKKDIPLCTEYQKQIQVRETIDISQFTKIESNIYSLPVPVMVPKNSTQQILANISSAPVAEKAHIIEVKQPQVEFASESDRAKSLFIRRTPTPSTPPSSNSGSKNKVAPIEIAAPSPELQSQSCCTIM